MRTYNSPLIFVGAKVRQIRRAQNITQEALAATIGCSPGTIHAYEFGWAEPRANILAALANGLDVPITDLYEPRQ